MELKQKVKKQDVQRLRQLIQAVADKNGEDAKLPISFLPFRGIIMVISLAGLAYGVVDLLLQYLQYSLQSLRCNSLGKGIKIASLAI